jgi:perosamine synthetase
MVGRERTQSTGPRSSGGAANERSYDGITVVGSHPTIVGRALERPIPSAGYDATLMEMSAPELDERDEASVLAALRSGALALGPFAEQFEQLASDVAGTEHAVAVSSGTSGLHLIVHGLGIRPGDDVLVPSFTFAASANVIAYVGARPVFVDVEPDTYNIDPADLAARRTPRTRAAMVVDVFGHPADWEAIERATQGLTLIDDCCEAIGARYRDRPLGSFGAAGCFAFYPNKQMTTGEGGMIVTDDASLAALCRSLRNQGRGEMGTWLDHERLGFNFRMDELSAALGVAQIRRLESFLAKRTRVAQMYTERLIRVDRVRPPLTRPDVTVSWFVYVVTLARDVDRARVIGSLQEAGIPSRAYFPPVHLQPYMRERFGTHEGMLPVTEDISRRTLALPFHNNLSEADVDRVVDLLGRTIST